MAMAIERRISELDSAKSLGDFWPPNSGPERCHELTGDRAGTFSMNLKQPYRLIFRPTSGEQKEGHRDDKTWWNSIESVELLAVEDTHE
jgi:proteic killer suppression protein